MGGSDKMTNGHRFDSIGLANGMIKQGISCQIIFYDHTNHTEFMKVVKQFDGVLIRMDPGQIAAAGGDQKRFDDEMEAPGKQIPIWKRFDDDKDIAGFAKAKGKRLADLSPEDIKKGVQICDDIGRTALVALKKTESKFTVNTSSLRYRASNDL